MNFVNLYVQTEYSILSSAISLKALFAYGKANNLDTLAICDNDMYGAYKFYQGCIACNIKPIIGLCLNIGSKEATDKILLFAYNLEGYQNLCKLSSIKQVEGFGEDVYAILSKYSKGILAILPGAEAKVLRSNNNDEILDNLLFIKGIYDYFYVGLKLSNQIDASIFSNLFVLCRANNIKMVALNKTLYLEKEEAEVYKTIKLISLISANQKEYSLDEEERHAYYLAEDEAAVITSWCYGWG